MATLALAGGCGSLPPAVGVAGAEAGWRCTAGVATAFREDPATGRWNTVVIPVTDQRYLVRPAASGGRWELLREAGDQPALPCIGDFDTAGVLRCGTGDQFSMNRDNRTFISHLFGAGSADVAGLAAATVSGSCVGL